MSETCHVTHAIGPTHSANGRHHQWMLVTVSSPDPEVVDEAIAVLANYCTFNLETDTLANINTPPEGR